jgi:serine/threonine protein kinase
MTYGIKLSMLQLAEIADGLAYLHGESIIHGDVRGVSIYLSA